MFPQNYGTIIFLIYTGYEHKPHLIPINSQVINNLLNTIFQWK